MTNNITESDPDFCYPFSPSVPAPYLRCPYHQNPNPRKKRTKMMIKFESRLIPSNTPGSGATISSSSTSSGLPKPKNHVKKPDPSAPKITEPCSECGKRFWSWKALYGHMRCHPERQWRGINPPPNTRGGPISPIQRFRGAEAVMTAEDHDVAESLLLLANSAGATTILETERGDCDRVGVSNSSQVQEEEGEGEGEERNCRFECSSCKKVFGTHQALGGHRASHKNVKGCFAITRSDGCEVIEDHSVSVEVKENVENSSGGIHKKVMVLGHHQCGICSRVFSSGQALGGHKRCHWEKGEEASSSMTANQGLNVIAPKDSCGLDLNLPAPVEEESSSSYSSGLTLDLRLGL